MAVLTLNRTIVELKLFFQLQFCFDFLSLNRTIVELKFIASSAAFQSVLLLLIVQ